ncbi:MAG: NAD(P)-dependent oxidoreductase [Pseudomonadales bacterium]|nr:NAD(P)-dependent oxidoreductase [Pseudomonadales bacterium]
MRLGLLHPGAMGVTVGAAAQAAGHEVLWLSAGRSAQTCARAEKAGLQVCTDLPTLVGSVAGMLSVCPPEAALSVAGEVMAAGFTGIYLDANAVAPATSRRIQSLVESAPGPAGGAVYVDGGLIGPPALQPGTTRLYLSGAAAAEVSAWFTGSALDARLVEGPAGSASALKMCYAAYTKGASALLLGVRALAEAEGVSAALLSEWALSQPDLGRRSEATARGTAPKAWRFVAEMEEIARSFEDRRLPGGFHHAAAQIYSLMSELKDRDAVTLAVVLEALSRGADDVRG